MRWSRLIMILAGTLLLVACILKAHQLLTRPLPPIDALDERWLVLTWLPCEAALGIVLIAGWVRRWTWLFSLIVFTGFAGVSAWRGFAGSASCGCFGVVQVSPWITMSLDLSMAVLLLLFRPETPWRVKKSEFRCTGLTLFITICAFIPIILLAAGKRPGRLDATGTIIGDSSLVVLDPASWRGNRWPLLQHSDIGARLNTGSWEVVLYHHDCPHCQETLPKHFQEFLANGTSSKIAAIALPPFGDDENLIPHHARITTGRLTGDREWFVATPIFLELKNGAVVTLHSPQDPLSERLRTMNPDKTPHLTLTKTGIDLGFVPCGSIQDYILAIPSKELLADQTVIGANSDCACVLLGKPITGQEQVLVPMIFSAPTKRVSYDKRILLRPADRSIDPLRFPIRAKIGLPIELSPSSLTITIPAGGFVGREALTVTNHGTKEVRLLFASCDRSIQIELPAETLKPGKSMTIPVVSRSPAGTYSVRISTDLPKQRDIQAMIKVLRP